MTERTMLDQWIVARAVAFASSHHVPFSRVWFSRSPGLGWTMHRPHR